MLPGQIRGYWARTRPARVLSYRPGTCRTPDVGAEPARRATPRNERKAEQRAINKLPVDLTLLEKSTTDHGHQPPESVSLSLSPFGLPATRFR